MYIGYARVSKKDGSQHVDLQVKALIEHGVSATAIYQEQVSGAHTVRPQLEMCLKALRKGDTLLVWKLDRLGRNLSHLIQIAEDLAKRGVGLKVIAGRGAGIDTTTPSGRMVFNIFGAFAEYEREQLRERTIAGLEDAREKGRIGGRRFVLSADQVFHIQAAIRDGKCSVRSLCETFKISRQTLYRYVSPTGELRGYGKAVCGEDVSESETGNQTEEGLK